MRSVKLNTRWLRLLVAGSLFAAQDAHAQAGLPQLDDASVVPRGLVRLRAITVWSRFDERFTDAGKEAIGAPFTSNALGQAQIASLRAIDSLASVAAGQPFTLSLGQSRLDARGRHEIVPIGAEYGLTNRITVGVIIAALLISSSMMMRVESSFRIFGYPGLAVLGYLLASAAAFYLIVSTFLRDKEDREKAKMKGR